MRFSLLDYSDVLHVNKKDTSDTLRTRKGALMGSTLLLTVLVVSTCAHARGAHADAQRSPQGNRDTNDHEHRANPGLILNSDVSAAEGGHEEHRSRGRAAVVAARHSHPVTPERAGNQSGWQPGDPITNHTQLPLVSGESIENPLPHPSNHRSAVSHACVRGAGAQLHVQMCKCGVVGVIGAGRRCGGGAREQTLAISTAHFGKPAE